MRVLFLFHRLFVPQVLVTFPQQAFWHMAAIGKSNNPIRKSRCLDLFREATTKDGKLKKFLADAQKLGNLLDELCDIKTEKGLKKVSLKDIKRSLPALIQQSDFSPILLPNERNMVATLPTSESHQTRHNPFPSGEVYISGK